MFAKHQSGFTLIEVAIVFVILAALLSYTFMPLRAQMETANIKNARAKLLEIEEAIYGFAIASGRLPCPTRPGLNGLENPQNPAAHCNNNAAIDGYIGFVPSATLGIKGDVNCDGLLVDPWGRPYMYSVSNSNVSGSGDFVIPNGISLAGGPTAVNAGITVCNQPGTACASGGATALTSDAVAVIFSMGTRERANSNAEDENAGEGADIASGCGLPAYKTGSDAVYYSANRIEVAGSEFDDQLIWISQNLLFSRLLQAGHTLQ